MIEKLRQLGWTDYEARAYLALLEQGPATGYRVGRASGVPVAKIYEALARLVERGAIRQVEADGGDTVRYTAISPDEVMTGLRARHGRLLDELSSGLMSLMASAADAPECEWLQGRAPTLGRANALLQRASRSVAIVVPTGWDSALQSGLNVCRRNGARIDRVAADPSGSEEGMRSALLVLAIDGVEALIADLNTGSDRQTGDAQARGLATRVPYLVGLSSDYVRLRRAVALMPEAVANLQRQDAWLDWEEAKQRRLLRQGPSGRAA